MGRQNPREKPQGQGTEDTTAEQEYYYPPCLFCSRNCEDSTNETIKRRRKQREQGFRNGVKLLCDVLNVPLQGSLEEALSLPICLPCDQLMRSVFELYRTIKSLEVKLRLKKETIVKHLKSQYRYDNVKDPLIATAALRIRRGFKKALGIDDGGSENENDRVVPGSSESARLDKDKAVDSIRIDGYYSLKEVKIPEGTTVRDCYVRLERLPKQTHVLGREVQDSEDTAELLENIPGHSLKTAESSLGRDNTGDEIPPDFNLHNLNAEEEIEVKDEDSDSEQPAQEAEVDTVGGRGGTLEENLANIHTDHSYAPSPNIKVPEGVSLRSCSIRLERLPKKANVQFSENSFGNEEHNSPGITPPTPTEHIVNPWERVETEVVIIPYEVSTEDHPGGIIEEVQVCSENAEDETAVSEVEIESRKFQLVQCPHASSSGTEPCLMWFVGEEERDKHFQRFHSKSKTKEINPKEVDEAKRKVILKAVRGKPGPKLISKPRASQNSCGNTSSAGSSTQRNAEGLEHVESEVVIPDEGFPPETGSREVPANSSTFQAALIDHSYSQTSRYQFPCNECNTGFTTLRELRDHKKTHGTPRKLQILKIVKSKNPKNRLKSKEDGPKKPRKSKLPEKSGKKDNSKPKSKPRKPYTKRTEEERRALLTKHKHPRPVICTFVDPEGKTCNFTFRDDIDMKAHVRRNHLGLKGHECYECPTCQVTYDRKIRLVEHLRVHTGERNSCDICGKLFRRELPLLCHRIRKHNIQGKFVCDDETCDKSFATRQGLRIHRYVHTGQFPFPCDQCLAGFGTRCDLNLHVKNRHAKTPIGPSFICEVCGKQFKKNDKLKNHILTHSEDRPFPCPSCPWAFKTPEKLKNHIQCLHDGSRPFLCQECGASFKLHYQLNAHLKSHSTRKKPFLPRTRRAKTPPKLMTLEENPEPPPI